VADCLLTGVFRILAVFAYGNPTQQSNHALQSQLQVWCFSKPKKLNALKQNIISISNFMIYLFKNDINFGKDYRIV
jgi:hypothetical protein